MGEAGGAAASWKDAVSAIERDREIAAKATQGVWKWNDDWDDGEIPLRSVGGEGVMESAYFSNPPHGEGNYEHIVRLHNRQPLYDALVDAVRDSGRFCGECRDGDPCDVHDALADLDLEGP